MRLLLLTLAFLLGTSLAGTLSSSNCIYDELSDTLDCSAITSVDEILTAVGELGATGHSDVTAFLLRGNGQVTHLPQGILGDVRFKHIIITDNLKLSSCGDILGASKTTVVSLDLSYNHLSYLPRMESTSLVTYKQNGAALTSIASNALNAVPNLEVIELQETGTTPTAGLFISDGAFEHLPLLKELNMLNYIPRDGLATKGSFTFASPYLHTVDLRSNYPLYEAEVGTFGGFNANTTLSVKLNGVIEVETFYNVFQSGSHVVVQETQPCQCNLDWIRFSCFLPQASIRCVYQQYYMDLKDIPADYFAKCCFGKN